MVAEQPENADWNVTYFKASFASIWVIITACDIMYGTTINILSNNS